MARSPEDPHPVQRQGVLTWQLGVGRLGRRGRDSEDNHEVRSVIRKARFLETSPSEDW